VIAAEWIEILVARAGALRAAGVTKIVIDGATVELAPPDAVLRIERPEREEFSDALDDPDTYGGAVPTLARRGDGA